MCAGSVPHNQTCVMVIMSADPVTMMAWGAGLVQVEHICNIPADPVQQYPAFLLVGCHCNIHYC